MESIMWVENQAEKILIFGGGPSIRYDVAHSWKGNIIACDIYAKNVMRFTYRTPSHIITLEDTPNMNHMFEGISEPKPRVVVSPRTTTELKTFLQKEKFEVIMFDDPLLEVIWNAGLMAWYYAWKVLDYREIYLTGFDSLTNNNPSMLEKLWQESFHEIRDIFAPKDLKTYMVGHRKYYPEPENIKITNAAQYVVYRQRRDAGVISRQMGNDPEPLYEFLI
jgi:hypothetical protein